MRQDAASFRIRRIGELKKLVLMQPKWEKKYLLGSFAAQTGLTYEKIGDYLQVIADQGLILVTDKEIVRLSDEMEKDEALKEKLRREVGEDECKDRGL